jgi:hypothetical protein
MKDAEKRTINCFAASSSIALCHQLRLHHVLGFAGLGYYKMMETLIGGFEETINSVHCEVHV